MLQGVTRPTLQRTLGDVLMVPVSVCLVDLVYV